jgi:hypothetical protein
MSSLKAFDPKYGSKKIMGGYCCTRMRSGRMKSCCKFSLFLLILWCIGYFGLAYVSIYKSELLDEFRKEDLNIKKLQDKIAELVAKGLSKGGVEEPEPPVPPQEMKVDKKEKLKQSYVLDDGITEEAARFIREFNLKNPGENGDAVELPKNLSADIQKRIKEGFDTYGYNGG